MRQLGGGEGLKGQGRIVECLLQEIITNPSGPGVGIGVSFCAARCIDRPLGLDPLLRPHAGSATHMSSHQIWGRFRRVTWSYYRSTSLHMQVSILFCDIVSYTHMSSEMTPDNIVVLLNKVYT